MAIYDSALQLITDSLSATAVPSRYRSHRSLVYQAIEYVEARPSQMIFVQDLCVALRVSRRTLQAYFHEVLQVSPLQYLRALRLNKVRSALQRSDGALSVGQAAADWGFWHLSQFAIDYRKLFGELPSQTADRSAAIRRPVQPPHRPSGLAS